MVGSYPAASMLVSQTRRSSASSSSSSTKKTVLLITFMICIIITGFIIARGLYLGYKHDQLIKHRPVLHI